MADLFLCSDAQWGRVEPMLPKDVRGMDRVDDRRVVSGITHALNGQSCAREGSYFLLKRRRL